MKISRIIFISFFTAISLFLLSFIVQSEKNKARYEFADENFDLPNFTHIKVTEGCNVSIKSSDKNTLHIAHQKDYKIEKPNFTLNGDTLVMTPLSGNSQFFIDVQGNNIKSVIIFKARVDLDKLDTGSLKITCQNGEFYTRTNQLPDTILLDSKLSHCHINARYIKLLQATLQKSSCNFYVETIEQLNANLRDTSELSTQKVLQANVQTDVSSRYYSR